MVVPQKWTGQYESEKNLLRTRARTTISDQFRSQSTTNKLPTHMKMPINVSLLLLAITLMAISCDKLNWDDPDRDGSNSECIDKSKIDNKRGCYEIYAPVCGCDDKTYGNDCEAERAGVTKWTEGACKKRDKCIDESKISNNPCPENIDFVCGCDGKTYNNACNAERAGVTKWKKGSCNKK